MKYSSEGVSTGVASLGEIYGIQEERGVNKRFREVNSGRKVVRTAGVENGGAGSFIGGRKAQREQWRSGIVAAELRRKGSLRPSNYNDPAIYITENGMGDKDDETVSLQEALKDNQRTKYYKEHLWYLQKSIEDGANVKGHFAWSMFDNFEWASGYTSRFGINCVDYKDGLKRYPKQSAIWYKKFLDKAAN